MFKLGNRNEIANFVIDMESKFPVNDWKYKGIHIWPYIRIQLFFYLIKQTEGDKKEGNSANNKQVVSVKNAFSLKIKFWLIYFNESLKFLVKRSRLKKVDFVFVCGDAHRVNYNNKRFNRYFDTLISKYDLSSRSAVYEYGKVSDEALANQDKVIGVNVFFQYFNSFRKLKSKLGLYNKNIESPELNGYPEMLVFLQQETLLKNFCTRYSALKITDMFSNEWEQSFRFYLELLERNKPKKILILCYYDFRIFSLIVAAKRLNIQTIEVQHGPQPDVHPAYSRWNKLPAGGYAMLPEKFWCWDQSSKNNLQKWMVDSKTHKVFIGGNPWIEYWKEQASEYKFKDFLLYSLQPDPVSIEQLFPSKLIEFIKKNTANKWFLRLHPRQIKDKENIKIFLKENNLLEFVDIENATNDPLPLLLANCKLHVTHFSGTTIEASMMNTHTVLLSSIGEIYFNELIKNGRVEYIDPNNSLFDEQFLRAINYVPKANNEQMDHSHTIKEMFA